MKRTSRKRSAVPRALGFTPDTSDSGRPLSHWTDKGATVRWHPYGRIPIHLSAGAPQGARPAATSAAPKGSSGFATGEVLTSDRWDFSQPLQALLRTAEGVPDALREASATVSIAEVAHLRGAPSPQGQTPEESSNETPQAWSTSERERRRKLAYVNPPALQSFAL